jgi:serine/threonine protein kinase
MSEPSARIREPIPGYVLKERIGVGGYGEVWSAQAPGDLSKAVKLVYGHFDDARASRELKALKRVKEVRHPFLLSLERIEVVDGQLVIVTELADRSLKERFEEAQAQGGCIPRDELLSYLRDAADALDYMSDNFSLQHLDVKPENLLLVGNHVKVADFGLVKELQDVTSSMMGGLTPVYASPEVFDGRPSQRSDQYSLAIVFQEMLTGVLPFPGKTAAQLASQHLHARPRLTSLPAADQEIIGRALAKDPGQRYGSCRELIDTLAGKVRSTFNQGKSSDPQRSADSISDTTSVRSRRVETEHQLPERSRDAAPSQNGKTMVIGEEQGGPLDEGHQTSVTLDARDAGPIIPPPAPSPNSVELPPLEIAQGESALRPTLFLAVGGAATGTLRHLRRQMNDRLGANASLPAIQMLAVDTNTKQLYQATQGDFETALSEKELLPLPLRSSRDYAAMSNHKLQSISRRWLYNIPRSLQTEGRRPLGRLALVDHAEQLFGRIREAIVAISTPEALAATSQATGTPMPSNAPRVFLLASIAGGTGGGMVIDVAYGVRKILDELGFDADGLSLVLMHGTDRNPTTADLSIANAYATLTELFHYSCVCGYPGDTACDLPPFPGETAAFPNAYLVHLGDNLNEEEFERASDSLASYLYLNTVTPVAKVFDLCRAHAEGEVERGWLRTVGLARVGGSRTALPELATEYLCHEVIDRWRGTWVAGSTKMQRKSLVELAAHRGNSQKPAATHLPADERAAEHAAQLKLDVASLVERVQQLVEEELGGGPEAVLTRLCPQSPEQITDLSAYVKQAQRAIDGVFGSADPEAASNGSPSPIQIAIEEKLKKLTGPLGTEVRQWILGLVELPDARVAMAATAKQWYDKHLRSMESQAQEATREKQKEMLRVVQAIKAAVSAPPKRGFFNRQAKRANSEITNALAYLVAIRSELATDQALARACRLIASAVAASGERIADLQRELGQLSQTFAGECPWNERGGETPAGDDVANSIAETIRQRMPEMVRTLDKRVCEMLLQPEGGLRNVLERADSLRNTLVRTLRTEARAEVLQTLKGTAIDKAMVGVAEGASQDRLHAVIDAAQPKLDRCGGQRRLLAVVPEASVASGIVDLLTHQITPPATVIADTDPDLVLCYEAQGLWIPYVGSRLIGDRGDLAQIALRLHTRSDVAWSDLARVGVGVSEAVGCAVG